MLHRRRLPSCVPGHQFALQAVFPVVPGGGSTYAEQSDLHENVQYGVMQPGHDNGLPHNAVHYYHCTAQSLVHCTTMLGSTALHFTALHCTKLPCTTQSCTAQCFTASDFTVLAALQCTAQWWVMDGFVQL